MITAGVGERSPRVVLIQILLNRAGTDPQLTVDGRFGAKTRAAVIAFQRSVHGLHTSGHIDPITWHKLPRGKDMNVLDVVDVGDPKIGGLARHELTHAGGHPIELAKMCNGVGQMVGSAFANSANGSVALLRITGHGNLGRWLTVSVGDVVDATRAEKKILASEDHSYISAENFDKLALVLAPLKSIFASYGTAEHGGCSLGGRKGTRELLHKLADLWDVPVSVGVGLQHSYLKFDGATFTAYPENGTLNSWSRQFRDMSL
jgi:hypothetical protein